MPLELTPAQNQAYLALSARLIDAASEDELGLDRERRLRTLAREAYEIAMRLPESDPDARKLLEMVVRTNPEAALALAQRNGQSELDIIRQYLELHADQPGWILRRHFRRALAKLK